MANKHGKEFNFIARKMQIQAIGKYLTFPSVRLKFKRRLIPSRATGTLTSCWWKGILVQLLCKTVPAASAKQSLSKFGLWTSSISITWNSSKVQILGPHHRPPESETLQVCLRDVSFNKATR